MKPPTKMHFSDITDSTFTVSWTPPIGKKPNYLVTVQQISDRGRPVISLPISKSTYVEITNLEPGSIYRFRVYAMDGGRKSSPLIGEQATSKSEQCKVRPGTSYNGLCHQLSWV